MKALLCARQVPQQDEPKTAPGPAAAETASAREPPATDEKKKRKPSPDGKPERKGSIFGVLGRVSSLLGSGSNGGGAKKKVRACVSPAAQDGGFGGTEASSAACNLM